jgi:small subunit ribosomal protein S9
MATTTKSDTQVSKASTKKKTVNTDLVSFSGKYFYAVGRRKSAVAQVRIYKYEGADEKAYVVNDKLMKDYFPTSNGWDVFTEALRVSGAEGKIGVSVLVRGGGLSGQAQAIRLGIARALTEMDTDLRSVLKAGELLTRDARVVERKKPGLRKARRSPQWSKR